MIEVRRAEMKKLSRDINIIIEKQYKKQSKEGPSNLVSNLHT